MEFSQLLCNDKRFVLIFDREHHSRGPTFFFLLRGLFRKHFALHFKNVTLQLGNAILRLENAILHLRNAFLRFDLDLDWILTWIFLDLNWILVGS